MLIWAGWGWLTPVIALAGVLLGAEFLDTTPTVSALILVAAGIGNFFIGRYFNNPNRDKVLVDPETGEPVRVRSRSTLFFIPMEWWSGAIVIFAVLLFIDGLG